MNIVEKPEFLSIESGEGRLTVVSTNRGEPYRKGIDLALYIGEYDYRAGVFLKGGEVRALRDLLNRLYPPK